MHWNGFKVKCSQLFHILLSLMLLNFYTLVTDGVKVFVIISKRKVYRIGFWTNKFLVKDHR